MPEKEAPSGQERRKFGETNRGLNTGAPFGARVKSLPGPLKGGARASRYTHAQREILTQFLAKVSRGVPDRSPEERARLFRFWRSIPHRRMDIAFGIINRENLTTEEFFNRYEPDAVFGWVRRVPEVETMHEMLGYDE